MLGDLEAPQSAQKVLSRSKAPILLASIFRGRGLPRWLPAPRAMPDGDHKNDGICSQTTQPLGFCDLGLAGTWDES